MNRRRLALVIRCLSGDEGEKARERKGLPASDRPLDQGAIQSRIDERGQQSLSVTFRQIELAEWIRRPIDHESVPQTSRDHIVDAVAKVAGIEWIAPQTVREARPRHGAQVGERHLVASLECRASP